MCAVVAEGKGRMLLEEGYEGGNREGRGMVRDRERSSRGWERTKLRLLFMTGFELEGFRGERSPKSKTWWK